ncbi:hypothetical protein ACFYRI_14370 [Streptomyces microflavus]|uniref:hypothetical protein n=1 Tax=Streptomyces microflavus TaxID=1919 RepID=UPI0036917EEF
MTFNWHAFGLMQLPVRHCASLHTRTNAEQSGMQLVFRFRPETAGEGAAGMVMIRLDVPADYTTPASRFVAELRDEHGLVAPAEEQTEEDGVQTIPTESPDWVVSPTNADSEELHREIFGRIAAESAP